MAIIIYHTPQLHLWCLCCGQIVWSPGSCRNEKGTRMIENGFSASNFSDAHSFQKGCRVLHYFHLYRKKFILKRFLLNGLLLRLSHKVELSEHSRVLWKSQTEKCFNERENVYLLVSVNMTFLRVLDTDNCGCWINFLTSNILVNSKGSPLFICVSKSLLKIFSLKPTFLSSSAWSSLMFLGSVTFLNTFHSIVGLAHM